MQAVQHFPRSDMTRQILKAVQHGQPAIIENNGRPEAAMVDIIDYYILRAVVYYHNISQLSAPENGTLADTIATLSDSPQERFNLVFAHYLSEHVSLARAAELLEMSAVDLRLRCARLDVSLRLGPANLEEARMEIEAALATAPISTL